jgi:hypothetical protein
MVFRRTIGLTAVLLAGLALKVQAAELISNGSFESGFTGWTVVNQPSPWYAWQTVAGGFSNDFSAPASPQHGTLAAYHGVTGNAGTSYIMQQVAIPSGTAALFWKHRSQMDLTSFCDGPAQCGTATYRVDVLNTSNVVLTNLFTRTVTADSIADTGWQAFSRNMAGFAGQTVRIRFSTTVTATLAGPGQLEIDQVSLQAPFVVTAAPASISGRVTDAFGRPVSSTFVTLTDHLGRSKTVTTNTFGYYKFDDLEVGNLYVVAAKHRRYRFNEESHVVNLMDNVSDMNFIASR